MPAQQTTLLSPWCTACLQPDEACVCETTCKGMSRLVSSGTRARFEGCKKSPGAHHCTSLRSSGRQKLEPSGVQSPHSSQSLVLCIRQMLGHAGDAEQYVCASKHSFCWYFDQHKSAHELDQASELRKSTCTPCMQAGKYNFTDVYTYYIVKVSWSSNPWVLIVWGQPHDKKLASAEHLGPSCL